MKKKLNIKLLLIILFILIIIVGCILYFEYGNRDNLGSLYINESAILKNENSIDSSNDISNLDEEIYKNDGIDKYDSDDVNNIDNFTSTDINNEDNYTSMDTNNVDDNVDSNVHYTEDDVVNYFEGMSDEISESKNYKEIFKEYFVTIVDFIFYDKDIKGYTFKELSNIAKIKVIGFALKIDARLEEYLPNYKENISSVSSNVYNNIKEKLVYLYMDISTNICENNVEGCNTVKVVWADIKDVCSIGWDFIKNITSVGIEKLKNWYEIYSGKK